jgi:type II secretory pathway pseudopilin PulG
MRCKPARLTAAFSLLELLVAITLLVLLLLIVTQLINSTTATTANASKRMDADSHARMIFDRMAIDFDKMVKRTDLDYAFLKQTGNDAMWFYSEAPAYFTGSPGASARSTVSLVGYRINSSYQLERLGKGLEWDGTPTSTLGGSVVFLTYPPGNNTPLPLSTLVGNWPATVTTLSTDPDYNVLSDQAYRLEFYFQLRDGTLSTNPYIPPATTINGFKDVSAVIVAIAILDGSSRKIVKRDLANPTLLDSAVANQMISALPDAVSGASIAQTWNNGDYLAQSGLPAGAAAQIRLYQRSIYLNSR